MKSVEGELSGLQLLTPFILHNYNAFDKTKGGSPGYIFTLRKVNKRQNKPAG